MTATSLQWSFKIRGVHMPLQISILLILCFCFGCGDGDSEKLGTIPALQDQVVQKDQVIARLEKDIKDRDKTIKDLQESETNQVRKIKERYDNQLADIRLIHREKLAEQQSQHNKLRTDFAFVIKEKLVLEELVDSEPRIERVQEKRSQFLVLSLLILTITASAGMVLFAIKYKSSREHVNRLGSELVVRIATKMKENARLEGKE